MNKFIAIYLAIRTPLLWVCLLLSLSFSGIVGKISTCIWLLTLIFSEYSYERYLEYVKKKEINNIDNEEEF